MKSRKQNAGNMDLPFEEEQSAPPARSPRRAPRVRRWGSVYRYGFAGVLGILLIVAGVFTFQRAEQFLISDPRFLISDNDEENSNLKIRGIAYASAEQISQVFSQDVGRSLYLLPLAERRRQLLTVDWVKDASISKLWPNRVLVQITERRPVAFVELPSRARGKPSQFALIDADGIILRPQKAAKFALPVLTGVRFEEEPASRRDKVRLMLRMLEELGPLAGKISEIDVGEPANVKVTEEAENRAIVLLLGDRNFSARMQTFLGHYDEIHRTRPDATVLDLRVEDRITAVNGSARSL